MSVKPLYQTIDDLSKTIKVEHSKLDKSLLKIKYEHRDRHLVGEIVNTLMESYQNFLKGTHTEIAANQLEYLNQRRDQLTDKLNYAMQRHADYLTDDLSNSGFIEASNEIDFLAVSQREYKKKCSITSWKSHGLQTSNLGVWLIIIAIRIMKAIPVFINTMLSDMRAYKHQRDALEIEIQKKLPKRA